MFGKKRLANKMLQGTDTVRLILYKVLTNDFSKKYQEQGEEYYKNLAGATVNEIFGSHNEASQITFDENNEIIINEIITLGTIHPELKQPITDAIRVDIQASYMLNNKIPENWETIFKNACIRLIITEGLINGLDVANAPESNTFSEMMERGTFIKGGNKPDPGTFLKMVNNLAKQYKIKMR